MRSGSLDHFELKNPGPRPDSAGRTFHAGAARLGVLPRQHVLDECRCLAHQPDASADFLRRVHVSLYFLGLGEIRTGDVAAKMAGLDFGTEAVVELCAERKETRELYRGSQSSAARRVPCRAEDRWRSACAGVCAARRSCRRGFTSPRTRFSVATPA